jgi:hypothetical protein
MIMEVKCCAGLLQIVQTEVSRAVRKISVKQLIICISGQILKEEWIYLYFKKFPADFEKPENLLYLHRHYA